MRSRSYSAGHPAVASSTSATARAGNGSAPLKEPTRSRAERTLSQKPPGVAGNRPPAGLTGAFLAAELFANLPDTPRASIAVRSAIEHACGLDPDAEGFDRAFINVIAPVLVAFASVAQGQQYFALCAAEADVDQALIARLTQQRRDAFVERMRQAKAAKRAREALRAGGVSRLQTAAVLTGGREDSDPQGIAWWNGMSELQRAAALAAAGTAMLAAAWAHFVRMGGLHV